MFKILICTHSSLAKGFKDAVTMIAGDNGSIEDIALTEGEGIESLVARIKDSLAKSKECFDGCLVFVDLYGASPFNAAMMALANTDYAVITGVNLPQLLEVVMKNNAEEKLSVVLDGFHENEEGGIKLVYPKLVFSKNNV